VFLVLQTLAIGRVLGLDCRLRVTSAPQHVRTLVVAPDKVAYRPDRTHYSRFNVDLRRSQFPVCLTAVFAGSGDSEQNVERQTAGGIQTYQINSLIKYASNVHMNNSHNHCNSETMNKKQLNMLKKHLTNMSSCTNCELALGEKIVMPMGW